MSGKSYQEIMNKSHETVELLRQAGMLEEEIRDRFPNVYDLADYQELRRANVENRKVYEGLMNDCLKIKAIIEELKQKPIVRDNDDLLYICSPMILTVFLIFFIAFSDQGLKMVEWCVENSIKFVVWVQHVMTLFQIKVVEKLIEKIHM